MIGPGVAQYLRINEDIVDVYLEGSDSRKCHLLPAFLVDVAVFAHFQLRHFHEFIGHRVFDHDGVVNKSLNFPFD